MTTKQSLPGTTYVIGHRNPDADAICSALAYADLKAQMGQSGYVAARCGNSNARIDAILSRFSHPLPQFVGDVTPRVRDIMIRDVVSIHPDTTCIEALELIDEHDVRFLPVVDSDNRAQGFISIFQLGGYFVPKVSEPRAMRHVLTSMNSVVRALQAKVLNLRDDDTVEDLYVKIGAMDIRSFGRYSEDENIAPNQSIIVVGDRWDIQQKSIQSGVRLLVVTGSLEVDDEVVELAKEKGVSLIVSPFDSATTAWIIRSASTVDRLIEREFLSFNPEERLHDVRRKVATSQLPAFPVHDDEGRLIGIFSKSDLLQPIQTKLVLVDHNEMSQAVPGAGEVGIAEIIDHHRLGSLNTQQPILFINEPVGSTCTIVAELFRRHGITPSAQIAGVMMGGIITDTLNLQSPTSTPTDGVVLRWLEDLSGVKATELAEVAFSSGSIILSAPPEDVVRSDFKIYEEESVRFAVAQVEELGFGNFWKHDRELANALEDLRQEEDLYFAALLVTDINTQNSLLIVKGAQELIDRINYAPVEKDEIFDMPGIVSRKKQLIPFITTLLRSLHVEGMIPGN